MLRIQYRHLKEITIEIMVWIHKILLQGEALLLINTQVIYLKNKATVVLIENSVNMIKNMTLYHQLFSLIRNTKATHLKIYLLMVTIYLQLM